MKYVQFSDGITRSFGNKNKQKIGITNGLTSSLPRVLEDSNLDPVLEDAFVTDVLPRSERASTLSLTYSFFLANYIVYRDIDTYDFPEDRRVGPSAGAGVGFALKAIGSENNYMTTSADAGWGFNLQSDGYASVGVAGSARYDNELWTDRTLGVGAHIATPRFGKFARFVLRSSFDRRFHDTANSFYTLGGETSLRGYPIAWFAGKASTITNIEMRTMPVRVWVTRLGAVLFTDFGHAAPTIRSLKLHPDIGVGLRFVIPQAAPYVWRIDWAVPTVGPTAGMPGRFVLGFQQVFSDLTPRICLRIFLLHRGAS